MTNRKEPSRHWIEGNRVCRMGGGGFLSVCPPCQTSANFTYLTSQTGVSRLGNLLALELVQLWHAGQPFSTSESETGKLDNFQNSPDRESVGTAAYGLSRNNLSERLSQIILLPFYFRARSDSFIFETFLKLEKRNDFGYDFVLSFRSK